MKIVYIGTSDELAEKIVERLGQEGNDVYLLSDTKLEHKPGISLHRFYRSPRKGETFEELLISISPDIVIFAGRHYINYAHDEVADEDVSLLAHALRAVSTLSHVKFILLSSIEVYGNTIGKADESQACTTTSERGIHFIREEQLLDIYHKQYEMDAVILRASQLYTNQPKEGRGDFLSRCYYAAMHVNDGMQADTYQPLHVFDFVDAIKRVIDASGQYMYNVCGDEISAKRLYQLICQQEKLPKQNIHWEQPCLVTLADSTLIRQELGWSHFRKLEDQIQKGEIRYEKASQKKEKVNKKAIPKGIFKLIENLLIFAVFFALQYICSSHSLLSQINWLMIYVVLISISYSIYQSTLAAVLASVAYLYGHHVSFVEMNMFYSYANSVLAVMEFVFVGLMVSYTINVLKEEARNNHVEFEMLKEEYEDLKAINEENVLIKNEYEERLLTSKSGFPKLYSLISRLMVEEPERILMETMQIISELVHTDTVAVYRSKDKSPWLRLVGALSDDSAMDGKTWNLSNSSKIYEAVIRGELYQGEFGSEQPAIVMPIVCWGVPEAVILIKRLPYESETMYHVNLLKTMSLLLRDSMEKALQYEELSRENHYVKDTDILKPEAFHKRIMLAKEKAEKYVAEYCVVEFISSDSLVDTAHTLSHMLRVTDCLGTDGKGRLFALLDNTDPNHLEYLQKRLSSCDVEVLLAMDELAEIFGEAESDQDVMGGK